MDDSLIDDEIVDAKATIAGKCEKAHPRAILGVWSFNFGGQIGVMTIGHDAAKLWALIEDPHSKSVSIQYQVNLAEWRNAVQAVEVTNDGKYAVVVGIDSEVTEIKMENQVQIKTASNDYLDAVHGSVNPDKSSYVTVAYSTGTLNEKDGDRVIRKEPLLNVKNVSVLKYSRDGKYIAIGQLDGGIELISTDNFKMYHKYEAHSMRIRKIEFLPDDDRFLSGCDDRLIKLHSLSDFANEVDPTRSTKAIRVYSAHDTPVTGLTVDAKSGGTRFASSSMSGQIFIWHIELTAPIITVANEHTSTICALSFSPTGRHLISGGDDSLLEIYTIPGIGGDESPKQSYYYPPESEEKDDQEQVATEMTEGSPTYQQDSQQSEEQYYQNVQDEAQPSSGYQEYRPYAEPRTPPPDDDDIGDYVYSSSTHQETNDYTSSQNYAPNTDYNPDAYDPEHQ